VGYNSQNQSAQVAVVESQVLVASNGDQGKTAMVSQFQKVTVAPWAMATPQVRGGGILSEKILGKSFIEAVATPLIQAVGTGDTEEKAKDNACYSLSKIIQGISVSQDKKIEDLLNNDPKLCQPLYNYISKAEVISSRKLENKIEVTVKTELLPIASILNIKLPPMPAIVKPVTMKEYSDKFGAQARVTTQRAAQLDGYRKLAEMMYGVVIKSKTVLQDMAIKDDRITSTVEGVVKGAEIVDTQYYSDGSITVIMAIRADLVRSEVAKVTGDIFGVNFFTSPTVIDINDLIK
jgi:hypothetical protein